MIRAFVALDLPEAQREALFTLQRALRRAGAEVSWVRPESVHLTLKFLGNIEEEAVSPIGEALSPVAAGAAPFAVSPSGCGAFPTLKAPRVVWVGLRTAGDELARLQKGVEAALSALGHPPEDRPFKPHLTLGRVKGSRNLRALTEALAANAGFSAPSFDVSEIVLYKSMLRPEGAVYSALLRIPLSGTPR